MKLTIEQAKAILAAESFAIMRVACAPASWDDDGDYDFNYSIAATNINNEYCMEELLKHLKETVAGTIVEILVGDSLYLCHMRFEAPGPQAAYSHDDFLGAYEPDPYWEIESYELISTEPIELDAQEES